MKNFFLMTFLLLFHFFSYSQNETYADKLGFPKGAKVIIMHVDDIGMSYDSNIGAIKAV